MCYSAPLISWGDSKRKMVRMMSGSPMRVKWSRPTHRDVKPGLALAGTGLSRSPGCRCVALMSRQFKFQHARQVYYRFSYCTVNWLLIYSEGKVLRMAQHFNNSGV